MSLIAWLPFTQDSRQQGLGSNVSVSGTISLDNSGKLGKCLNSSNEVIINTNHSFGKIWSFCFWGYVNGSSVTANWTQIARINDGSSNLRIEVCPSSYSNGIYCYSTHNNAGYAITNGAIASPSGGYYNQWAHFCLTSNGTTITKYMNGVSVGTCAYNGSGTINGTFVLTGNHITKKNDARIYDHCLSPMEVKELAKGLVLHYPLNRQGWGQENLLKNSNFLQGTNGMQGYTATSATCTKQADCMKVVSTSASGGFYTSNFNSITTGDMTTFSADVKADNNMTIYIGTDGSGNGSCQAYTIGTSWQRISISKAKTTNNANLRIYGNGTFYAKNLKYEKGSIATPWCPNSSDTLATTMGLNSTTEYDCSGFCNNGTRTGTFTWTSDTPKYAVSQVFNGSQYIVESNEINTVDSTIALWIKSALSANAHVLDARNGSEIGKQPIYQYTNGSIQTGGNNAYVTTNTGLLVANTWVHVALVQSGNSLLVYKNGTLFQTISCNNSSLIKPTIGARLNFSNKYTGQLSDVRIYATALSASDVKSLYQNSAYIDSSGNVYGAVHSEV